MTNCVFDMVTNMCFSSGGIIFADDFFLYC